MADFPRADGEDVAQRRPTQLPTETLSNVLHNPKSVHALIQTSRTGKGLACGMDSNDTNLDKLDIEAKMAL